MLNGPRSFAYIPLTHLTMMSSTRITTTCSKASLQLATFFPSHHSFSTGLSIPTLLLHLDSMDSTHPSSSTYLVLLGGNVGCFYERVLTLASGLQPTTMFRALLSARRTSSTPRPTQVLQTLLGTASYPSTLRFTVLSQGLGTTPTPHGYYPGFQTDAAEVSPSGNASKSPGTPRLRSRLQQLMASNYVSVSLTRSNSSTPSIMLSLPDFWSMLEFIPAFRTLSLI